jgi:DNA-binding transcriptional ArsR family regulator
LPRPEHEELAEACGLLADTTRLRIVLLLANGERNVSALKAALEAPQPTVSHHLGLLRVAGFVDTRREGRQIIYRLRSAAVDGASCTFECAGNRLRFTVANRDA